MKYLKSYLESNQMIDEGDLETISNLFKFVEDELMLKRSEGTLEKNELKPFLDGQFTPTGTTDSELVRLY